MSGPYRHIGARTTDGTLVLTIEVEQVKDFTLSEELRYELVHAVKSREAKRIILDLHNMKFMTSLACVCFIGLKHAVKEKDGRLVLCCVSEFIRKILDAKRLLSRSQHTGNVAFEAVESMDDALRLFDNA